MFNDVGLITLAAVTLLAAAVNGGLGYGFSSITVPIALVFYANRILNPALVLVEVALNGYLLFINRRSVPLAWKRVLPILVGLFFGVIAGSQLLSVANPDWLKFFTYAVVLPLILLQASGVRRPIPSERLVGVPFGAGVGILYSLTTISGPPLALLFNNQGYVKEEFRASLGLIRVAESSLTAIAYYWLGLYSANSAQILVSILPSVAIGIPLGAYLIRQMPVETFRRICMSFDAWVVGFGLSRVLIALQLLTNRAAYSVWLSVILIDAYLLYLYFDRRQSAVLSSAESS
jgi:uncharacterized membrane protein YfcA